MDLARHSGAFLGNSSTELGAADRTPDTDQENCEREDAQEIALQHVVTRSSGRENVVKVGEDDERQREREPAVEVATVAAVAQPEADDRNE